MESAATGWLNRAEAQFHLRKINNNETKFYHIISALPPEILSKLPNVIYQNKDYDELKTAVIASYESTKPELFDKLISKTTMSGRPSVYLQELSATAAKIGVGDELVCHKFMQASPPTIPPVLAAHKSLTLQQQGTLTDELIPYFTDKVLHVKDSSQPAPQKTSQNPSENNPSFPTGLRPYSADQRPKICRAHLYFADKARTCKPWCLWPTKTHCKMQASSRPASPAPSKS